MGCLGRPGWDNWGQGKRSGYDGELDLLDLAEADVRLHEYLHRQLNTRQLSERDHLLASLVVEALDDDGYLRMAMDEIGEMAELTPPPDECELGMALKLVQSFEPAGVGARDVRECLLLQLENLPPQADAVLISAIVGEHLNQLAQRDIKGIAKALGRTPAEIEQACEHIRHLEARPGWQHDSRTVAYITPDVIVRKQRGLWTATLNPAVVPRVRLNQVYAELFQSHRESHHGDMASHLQEARWTVRNVEQRFATILRVSEAIVERQKNFFEYGPLAMKPLGLKEIAEVVGLHESTVSRVTNNKYMATPAGVFELKYFFSRALATTRGGACSATAIRSTIKDMIAAETGNAPVSDAEIARLLGRQGLQVARRTVTKYRQMMRIPAVEMRRQHA
ncbi:RNA polymerase factor sigma-54 [Chitinimonas arctica]|uniref:RNA polymerase factor sigma-54 n=1 Tax=Chitinimonas arctica TaxID=2594795 RepID=UPI001CC7A699|nr:RNA polymerase factor sigma-54 [Chitinimonas arctica]